MTQAFFNGDEGFQDYTIGIGGAGTEYGVTEFSDDGQADGMIRHPNAGSLAFGQHNFRYQSGSFQDKGIRSGKQPLHGFVSIIGDLGVLADVLEIRTNKAEGLVLGSPFELINAFDGFLVENIAANAVKSVSWIGDDTSTAEDFHCSANEPFLRVLGVDLQDHDFTSLRTLELEK